MMRIRKTMAAAAVFLAVYFPALAAEIVQTTESQIVSLLASGILVKQHYLKQRMTPEMQEQFLLNYLNELDPFHMYFTRGQIRAWKSFAPDLLKRLFKGDAGFAYRVYQKYLLRLEEYQKFVHSIEITDKDLAENETLETDRLKASWPENSEEMRVLWRKKLKNDIITLKILDDITKSEAAGKKEAPKWKTLSPMERIRKRTDQFVNRCQNPERFAVVEQYVNALAALYDPHTAYMAPKTEENFNINMKLSLIGIGAVLSSADDGSTRIVEIMPGGPAEKSGQLHPEDRIIAVAQGSEEPVDVIDMPLTKVVSMIRGQEGTEVTITALDAKTGASGAPKKVRMIRTKVELKESEAKAEIKELKTSDGRNLRIGVITLPSFYYDFQGAMEGKSDVKSSTGDVTRLLQELRKNGEPDALVMDLRANGGGSLNEAIRLTGLFIPEGPVVQIRNASGSVHVEKDNDGGKVEYGGPLVVLTSKLSASASEIFAGAIQDYGRGVIVGDLSTHGKGTVQTLLELDDYLAYLKQNFKGGVLKVTKSKFYRVNGESTQLKGVIPDIILPSVTDDLDLGESQLKNPMPWDAIDPVNYQKTNEQSSALFRTLRQKSMKRVAADPEFEAIRQKGQHLKELRARKTISLNYKVRWQEYQEQKKILEARNQFLKLDVTSEKDKKKIKDPFMEETIRIAADWAGSL